MRSWLPRDRSRRVRTRRGLVIAGVCSVLLHVLLAALILFGGLWSRPQYAKKGEPLFVDIAPDKPEEKAPLGNPSRPPSPVPAREAPRPPAPKAPEAKVRVAEAPRPAPTAAAPAPPPPAPAPPQQVAKAAPEPPAPNVREPAPTATPQAAPPPHEPAESVNPPSPSTPPGPLTARSSGGIDLPAAMLKRPPGGGLQGGRGGVEGEPIPLDTPDPKYQDYFRILRERIQSKWTYPREAGDRGIGGALLIEFHIAKDGRLSYLEIRRSSGVDILDEYAVNAVKLAQPFPPVPDNLAKQVLAINGNFVYHIVENSLVKQFTR
jgi:periplasmic protein TonB